MQDIVGQTLTKYHLIRRIGRGGMADIYLSKQPGLDRDVAIKVLNPYTVAEDANFVNRFRREGRAAAALRHPNIVQIFDFDNVGDLYFLVMEYIEGRTLKQILEELRGKGQVLTMEEVLRIIGQVGDALDYAHQRACLHRDVKPSNIMITQRGEAILMDFGIARIMSSAVQTTDGTISGTPAYMSPEQGRDDNVDHRSDLYSLGIVLYEMLVGRVPFSGDTPLVVMMKHERSPLPPLSQERPDLPQTVELVLNRTLAKDPDRRYQSAYEVVEALHQALDDEGTPSLPALVGRPLPPLAASQQWRGPGSLPEGDEDPADSTLVGPGRAPAMRELDLHNILLFAGLTSNQVNTIAQRLRKRSFRAGEQIFRKDDYGYDVYIIKSGQVRIYTTDRKGEEIDLVYYGDNDLFGELSLLLDSADRRRTADALAITDVEMFTLGRDDLLCFLNEYAQMSWNMIKILAGHLHSNTKMREMALVKSAGERLAERLVQLTKQAMRAGVSDKMVLEVTLQELAESVTFELEVLDRELRKLQRQGVVRVTDEGVEILRFGALRAIAEGGE
jgi:serine/threonine protein kinase